MHTRTLTHTLERALNPNNIHYDIFRNKCIFFRMNIMNITFLLSFNICVFFYCNTMKLRLFLKRCSDLSITVEIWKLLNSLFQLLTAVVLTVNFSIAPNTEIVENNRRYCFPKENWKCKSRNLFSWGKSLDLQLCLCRQLCQSSSSLMYRGQNTVTRIQTNQNFLKGTFRVL